YVRILGSYEFRKVEWTFFNPLAQLFTLDIPIAFVVDIPKTWEQHKAVAHIEGIITAQSSHLAATKSIDTTGQRQLEDCYATIRELHSGQTLHQIQFKIAVFADDLTELRKRVMDIKNRMKPTMSLREEVGPD